MVSASTCPVAAIAAQAPGVPGRPVSEPWRPSSSHLGAKSESRWQSRPGDVPAARGNRDGQSPGRSVQHQRHLRGSDHPHGVQSVRGRNTEQGEKEERRWEQTGCSRQLAKSPRAPAVLLPLHPGLPGIRGGCSKGVTNSGGNLAPISRLAPRPLPEPRLLLASSSPSSSA